MKNRKNITDKMSKQIKEFKICLKENKEEISKMIKEDLIVLNNLKEKDFEKEINGVKTITGDK